MRDANRQLLIQAARLLDPFGAKLVYVGGCATGLLITDPTAANVRATLDVDVIVEITSYAEYTSSFARQLRRAGFTEDSTEGAPLCRWRHGELVVDVMPLDAVVLGFTNRWYREAMETAVPVEIAYMLAIRVVTAPLFIATKFEAFHGRCGGDYFAGHDLEDAIAVVDGRPELAASLERFHRTSAATSRRNAGNCFATTASSMPCPATSRPIPSARPGRWSSRRGWKPSLGSAANHFKIPSSNRVPS